QFLVAGITGTGATGVWNVTGGSIQTTGNNGATLGATANTTGVLNISGTGSYSSTDATANGAAGIYVGENGAGMLNVWGSGAMTLGGIAPSAGLNIGRNNNAAVSGVVNLGIAGNAGGLITTNIVQKTGGAATGIFNFHGGTLRASTTPATNFMTGLSAAYVYG